MANYLIGSHEYHLVFKNCTEVKSCEIPKDVIPMVKSRNTAIAASVVIGYRYGRYIGEFPTMTEDDNLYMVEYNGPWLPEGLKQLSKNEGVKFFKVVL